MIFASAFTLGTNLVKLGNDFESGLIGQLYTRTDRGHSCSNEAFVDDELRIVTGHKRTRFGGSPSRKSKT